MISLISSPSWITRLTCPANKLIVITSKIYLNNLFSVNLEIAEFDLAVGELAHQDNVLRLDVEVGNVPVKCKNEKN